MRLITNRYVRWFNRRSRRDGPLFRGRFRSRPVESLRYRSMLVTYIDANPVVAGLVPVPELYPHGSAAHYVRTGGPIWLERSWVEEEARSLTGARAYSAEIYRGAFARPQSSSERELVEARMACGSRDPDPLDDLLVAGPKSVLLWLQEKARNADGKGARLPSASPPKIQQTIVERATHDPTWSLLRGTRRLSVWQPMTVGLLRDLGGISWKEVQERTGLAATTAKRAYETHRVWMEEDVRYGDVVGELGARCV